MNKITPSSFYNDHDNEWIETSYPPGQTLADAQLSPNGSPTASSTTTSKPIRRRSRASKKIPTTLLNANAKNFRSLVQQFTGCPSTSMSFRNQRGPVNLNFGLKNATPLPPTFGNPNYDCHHQQQQYYNQTVQPQQQQSDSQESNKQVGQLHEQCMYSSFDNIITTTSDNVFQSTSSTSMNPNPSMQISDGFSVENIDHVSLQDYDYLT
ncbi:hypothetical protein FNV43_RR06122 [Rhamnella rubrinervis]|uniref:VQ domain-containing protein n=1 Tax=Rhamnella rubrinervis TaxID=2594499 RepID=A0A8K0HDZ1_9ROSA|nr:hypothetical protein FNV43_RR06122 [Rhamnella rubrinervis]